jgi:hypothetical protein
MPPAARRVTLNMGGGNAPEPRTIEEIEQAKQVLRKALGT